MYQSRFLELGSQKPESAVGPSTALSFCSRARAKHNIWRSPALMLLPPEVRRASSPPCQPRTFDAIDTLLLYQNDNGALSSYEARRAGEWMEMFNVAEVFGNIMVEYDYPECTTACVTALSLFHKHWPEYRREEITLFIKRATNWIRSHQRPDGSWYGSWGICFTYATMFALESMRSVGETYGNSKISRRGCDFLVSKQRDDGGWSESYKVSPDRRDEM